MAKPLNNPHDRFFRETFSRREVVEGFLRHIEQADGETLLRWSEQILFAATPDEALR